MSPKHVGAIAATAMREFFADNPFQYAAALSYYTLLSIAPLLLVITGVAGVLLSESAVQAALIERIRELVGPDGAELARTVIENAEAPGRGVVSMVVGILLVLIGASTVFAQLQVALNRVFHVVAAPSNAVKGLIRQRLLSLTIVFGIGFLLWVSLIISALIEALYGYIERFVPVVLLSSVNILLSLAILTGLLALLFRFVPDVHIEWRDTWVGAASTAVLFTIGKFLIGLYLGQAGVGSAYGAAGSAVVLMVWVYYSSLILFVGAEITKAVAKRNGRTLLPTRRARRI